MNPPEVLTPERIDERVSAAVDALLAQSAIDRLTSGAHTLIVEGPSYRQRGRVTIDPRKENRHAR